MQVLKFTVLGPPVGKERARSVPGQRHYTPAKTRAYEALVAACGHNALVAHRDWPYGRASREWFRLTIDIYFGRGPRPDTSNVLKAVEDALNGVIWKDDRELVSGTRDVHLDVAKPRVEVEIEHYRPYVQIG